MTQHNSGLVHVVWELTLRCDLACRHCGSRAGRARESELTTAEALDVVRQLAALGVREVSLIGGESYLRADWDTLASSIVARGMECTMVSGGRAFTKERAERAANAGIRSVSLSLDGLAAAHDHQRGLFGSFDAVLASAANLREYGVAVTLNSQLNRLSWPDIDALLDLCIEQRCMAWQVAMTVPMGRASQRLDWLFQPDDLLDVFPKLAEVAARARERGVLVWPGNNVGYFGPYESMLRGGLVEGAYYQGCLAGRTSLGIEANGDIKGCPSLPSVPYVGGNVRRQTIAEIFRTAPQLSFARDAAPSLWGACGACYYRDVCRGGCNWTSHVWFGRAGNNPYCHHRALVFDERGEREQLTLVSRAPGAPFDHGIARVDVLPARSAAERADAREKARSVVVS